jgi:hypothetical protein
MAEADETPPVKPSVRLELDDLLTWGALFRFVEIARQYEAGPDSTIPCHVGDDGNVDAYILYLTDKKIRAADPPLDQVNASHEDLA